MHKLLTLLFTLITQVMIAQQLVLDSLDLEAEEFKIYFIYKGVAEDLPTRQNGTFRFEIDSTKSFLIRDKQQQLNLKSKWIGTSTKDMLWCGFDYYIYIVKHHKIEYELKVNLGCGYVETNFGNFYFEDDPVEQLEKRIPIWVMSSTHNTLVDGRNFIKSLSPEIILPDYHFWFDYDGKFSLWRNYEGKEQMKVFENRVSQMYSGKNYFLRLSGGGAGTIMYEVYCDSMFYKEFEFEKKLEWRQIEPRRITYFTEKVELLMKLINP